MPIETILACDRSSSRRSARRTAGRPHFDRRQRIVLVLGLNRDLTSPRVVNHDEREAVVEHGQCLLPRCSVFGPHSRIRMTMN